MKAKRPINYKSLRRKYPDIVTYRAVSEKLRRRRRAKSTKTATGEDRGEAMTTYTEQEEIENLSFKTPHCFILGAGASLAAFPDGDKNGRKLPVVANFCEVLGIDHYFEEAGIPPPYDDFEAIYSTISSKPVLSHLVTALEQEIFDYFAALELPDYPTLYDHLILSLREKDVIATFNWDPFLVQAAQRNARKTKVPKLYYLHGCVAIAHCEACKLKVPSQPRCPRCEGPLQRSQILYPVTQKDYVTDPLIKNEWDATQWHLKHGYILTIFGYGAPSSDVEAVRLLKEGWGNPEDRSLEEVEIIDVLERAELEKRWEPFIHTHHSRTTKRFYESLAGRHPRRSCEVLWQTLMYLRPSEGIDFPSEATFPDLYEYLEPRLFAELRQSES